MALLGDQYVSQDEVFLCMKEGIMWGQEDMKVKDKDGNDVFKIDVADISVRDRRRLLDSDGNQVATLYKAMVSMHHRAYINAGASCDEGEAIATITKVLFSFGHNLEVTLKGNDGSGPDYKVEGDFLAHNFKINDKDGNTIAEVSRELFAASHLFFGSDTYQIKVSPGVDYAFIVSLANLADLIFRDD